jgi:hypothetical protein
MGHFRPAGGYPALVAAPPGATVDARERRTMAGVLLGAAVLIAAYWVAWLVHRSLVASETGAAYTQFEVAFPLADGWLALCLVAAWELAINLVTLSLSAFALRWAWIRREALLTS